MTNDDDSNNDNNDEEGLKLKYDVIVCGTGLIQSILACALARAGKSVLHCDAQGHYGELDAVLTLPYILEGEIWSSGEEKSSRVQEEATENHVLLHKPRLKLQSTDRLSSITLDVGTKVATPYGPGSVKSMPTIEEPKLEISITSWVLANNVSPSLFIRVPPSTVGAQNGALEKYLAHHQKIRPCDLILAEDLLDKSSRSFAIDISPALIFGSGSAVAGFLKSNVSEYLEFKTIEGLLWLDPKGQLARVPCSKRDVFSTKLLNPLEKRKLMKFLQLVMDYGTSLGAVEDEETAEEAVESLNERQLKQGRSLSRPQNKAVKLDDLELLKSAIQAKEMNFDEYLTNMQKLSASLKSLVRYALALETNTESVSLEHGMKQLCHHLQGLGQFGTTAFLAPMYGSGEFPQAFCRSAAVYGATYLLRRAPKMIKVGPDGVEGVLLMGPSDDSGQDKIVACEHAIVSAGALQATPSKFVLRRVSIVSSRVLLDSSDQRHVILIPPKSSLDNNDAIHGLILDSSTKVAPPGCTLLHLTTVVDCETDETLLDRAAQHVLPDHAVELYHVGFSFPLEELITRPAVGRLHVCKRSGPVLAADDAFQIAQEIFETICPEIEFLGLSEKMDSAVKENMIGREEEDEERDVLDKAAETLEEPSVTENDKSAPENARK